jgi:hypothetical protein
MKPEEKHALLLVDEMAIKSGLEYDNTTGEILGMYYLVYTDIHLLTDSNL